MLTGTVAGCYTTSNTKGWRATSAIFSWNTDYSTGLYNRLLLIRVY